MGDTNYILVNLMTYNINITINYHAADSPITHDCTVGAHLSNLFLNHARS